MATYQGLMTVKRRPKDGADGDGIVSTLIEYAKSTDGTTPPEIGWSTSLPSPTQGWYLWTRTTTTYKQSPTTVAYSVSRWPVDGSDGLPGIQGPVVIQKEWVLGDTHRNTDEIKDYIYVRGATKEQSYWYTLINKGTVTAGAPPVGGVAPSGYESVTWLRDLAVQFLIAEEANLANFIFKDGKLISVRGTVDGVAADYAGQANFIPNIVIDGANGSISSESSNIRGTIHATDGEFTGVINAIGGRIAGFRISGNSLTNQNSDGTFITDATILFRNDDIGTFVAIGGNVSPAVYGTIAVARFENNESNIAGSTNYGVIVKVTGATNNIAILTEGDIVSKGSITGYTYATITPAINTYVVPGELTPGGMHTILFKIVNDNSGIALPSRYSIATVLGISNSTPFAYEMVLICSADSTKGGKLYGRTTELSFLNSTQYPQRLNENGKPQNSGFNMAAGDSYRAMLIWDGTYYRAYTLNRNY